MAAWTLLVAGAITAAAATTTRLGAADAAANVVTNGTGGSGVTGAAGVTRGTGGTGGTGGTWVYQSRAYQAIQRWLNPVPPVMMLGTPMMGEWAGPTVGKVAGPTAAD